MSSEVQKTIADDIKKHKILMYVKGNKGNPMCGFSKMVMDIFFDLGADFETRDVLSDPEVRDGVKEFTQWPTIPQIFINGEFIGGCDIVRDLYTSGELKKMVDAAK
ncbi:MAG: Grx4 family monothiol glutaredoxin [Proteobacteria bacterium]|nr:Grx4 family monothiol glutaredoxin [Pseudomonadota bacterium]